MKVHLVMGNTGGYEESLSWPVKAFVDVEKAIILAEQATKRAEELIEKAKPHYWTVEDGSNEHDPGMQVERFGVKYSVVDLEVVGAVRKVR